MAKIQWPDFNDETAIGTLVKISRFYGSDPAIVLAGGGNTSGKIDGKLFVKGSGHSLATIPAEGFVEMDIEKLLAILDVPVPADVNAREAMFKEASHAARLKPQLNQRPSVECVLHALVPGAYVVHSHATTVNMLTCCVQGQAIINELFGDEAMWIPYIDPGLTLARKLRDELAAWQKKTARKSPLAIFMQNHGMILGGDTPDEIRRKTDDILAKIDKKLSATSGAGIFGAVEKLPAARCSELLMCVAPALRGLFGEVDGESVKLPVVTFEDGEVALSVAAAENGSTIALGGPLTPDQIVYCKSLPLWFAANDEDSSNETVNKLTVAICEYKKKFSFMPKVVVLEGVGIFCVGSDLSAARTVRDVYLDAVKVMAGAKRFGEISYLSQRDREFLENWEVENYRRKVSAGSNAAGRVDGKIAVVTGAAQGFGLEIAQSLAAQGANVILGDINAAGLQAAADGIVAATKAGRSMGLAMNVTDGESLAAAMEIIVRTYGGVDVFVSNAGVVRAGSVKEQSVADFEFVAKVNYTGYFLCVQKVSPVMAWQHRTCLEWRGDIIQINSKSGLSGSNRNGAYAGSKFGGIGLTQSFALELVEDGIKVNSICPGNFFDGPLWSDPEKGLFMQYLRSGKVPGAKSVEDVKRFYESKVPMGRGCRTADVMHAVFYLIDQKYETGQAVPVTGGQVMLK